MPTPEEAAREVVRASFGKVGSSVEIDQREQFGRVFSGENGHGNRRNLVDPGSCEVPKGETLTLGEWKAQQAKQGG